LTWRVLAVAATRVAAAAKKASRSHRKEIKKDSIRRWQEKATTSKHVLMRVKVSESRLHQPSPDTSQILPITVLSPPCT